MKKEREWLYAPLDGVASPVIYVYGRKKKDKITDVTAEVRSITPSFWEYEVLVKGKNYMGTTHSKDEAIQICHAYLKAKDSPNLFEKEEEIKLLKTLAEHLTSKTEHHIVPPGTLSWEVTAIKKRQEDFLELPTTSFIFDKPTGVKHYSIPLYPFFGMMVGYNVELDILVYWYT